MLKVGLTAGIGCGKSLIAHVFETIGIPVFYSDKEAKRLYEDESLLNEIAIKFGKDVVIDGKFQAKKLAAIVFCNEDKLQELNAMIHPRVFELFDKWSRKQTSPYVIMESAILFENNLDKHFSKTIGISTPQDIVVKRVMQRDNCTKEQVLERINSQMPQEEKNKLVDYLIHHDDKTMLLPQILRIHEDLLKR